MPALIATEEFKQLVNAAMEQCGGDSHKAAILVGKTRAQLNQIIHNNKDLKARWSKPRRSEHVDPPSDALTIHRPAPPAVVEPEDGNDGEVLSETELAEALEKENRALKKGLDAMGVHGKSLDFAVALQDFHSRHYTKAVHLVGGGVTKLFIDLMAEIEKISVELNDAPNLEPGREAILRQDRAQLIEAVGRTSDRANKAAMTQAVIKYRLQEGKAGKSNKKPGYLSIQAQPDSTVNVLVSDKDADNQ